MAEQQTTKKKNVLLNEQQANESAKTSKQSKALIEGSRLKNIIRSLKIELKITTEKSGVITFTNREFGGDIVNATYSQGLGYGGLLRFTIVNRNKSEDLRRLISVMSLVEFFVQGKCLTVGIIKRVSKSLDYQDGKPASLWIIDVDEIGTFFKRTMIFSDANASSFFPEIKAQLIKQPIKYNFQVLDPTKATINNIIKTVMAQWFKGIYEFSDFKFSDGSKLGDRLVIDDAYIADDLYFNVISSFHQLWNFQGDAWSLINSFLTPPFHECFCVPGGGALSNILIKKGQNPVTEEGKIYLVVRPTPYDNRLLFPNVADMGGLSLSDINDLSIVLLYDSYVVSKELYCGNEDLYTSFSVTNPAAIITDNLQRFFFGMTYDQELLKRFGLRPLQVRMNGLNLGYNIKRKEAKALDETMKIMAKKLWSWYTYSDRYYSGRITIGGFTPFNYCSHVGMRLNYLRDKEGHIEDINEEGTYYIQGVEHIYNYPETFLTTYNVIRGSPTDVDQIKKFKTR